MIDGIHANKTQCEHYIEGSLAMCTSLVPIIGYDEAAKIAHESFKSGKTIREVVVEKNILDKKIIDSLGGKKIDNFQNMIQKMDYISLHMPLTDKTRNLINMKVLSSMRKNSIIINASRGGIINEMDLNEALYKGMIFGAGLDVFEKEPVDPDYPLLRLDNVVATPHMAGTTWDTWARRANFGFENMERVRQGEAPQAVVRNFDSS